MKKKSIVLAMLLSGSLLFTGCGSGGSDDTAASKDDKSYSITFVLNSRDEFTNTLADGMQERADELGVNLSMQDAANDTGKLLQFVETAKNAGEDAVVVFPIDSETIPTITDAAGDMPIVFVNRAPDDLGYLTENTAYVAVSYTHLDVYKRQIMDMSDARNRKQERQARLWAYNKLIGLRGIIEAYEAGCQNRYEIAEYLEVTEGCLQECIELYRDKYGTGTAIDNYYIMFIPHLAVGKMV